MTKATNLEPIQIKSLRIDQAFLQASNQAKINNKKVVERQKPKQKNFE